MLKIVGPIALAIISISVSGDETTNGLQRRLVGDDDKYKPILDIWNGDNNKKDKKDDHYYDNDNGKYIDDNHRYSQYKPYYHDNNDDKNKGWNADSAYASNYKPYDNYRQNKWNNDDGPDQYYKGWKNNNHYEADNVHYGANRGGYSNNWEKNDNNYKKQDKRDYDDNKQKYNNDYDGPYHSTSSLNAGYASNYKPYDNDRQNKWNDDHGSDQYYKGWKKDTHYEADNVYYGANRGGYSNNWEKNGNNYNKQDKRDYDDNKQKYNDVYRPYQSNSPNQEPMAMYVTEAIVILNVGDGSGVDGFIKFEDIDYGKKTKITAKITGLKPGKHGWHIHQFGDIFTDGCASAGPHYNPFINNHGSPDNDKYNRHIGDLGNIIADKDGVAYIDQYDDIIKLNGPFSIIGRGFVIHSDQDDLGTGGDDESLQTGNAGDRIACGVIGIKKED